MTQQSARARRSKAQRRAARKAEARKRAQRQQILRWGGIAVVAAIAVVATFIFMNRGDDLPEAIAYESLPSDGRSLGSSDAPVEFVIYSDFLCPFCKQFDDRDFPPLVENFVASGDVQVEWRPLPIISSIDGLSMDSPDNASVKLAEAAV